MQKRKLDWRPKFDPRSRAYGIKSIVDSSKIEDLSVLWPEGIVLDQGAEGACVGFGWAGDVLAEPVSPKTQPTPEKGNADARSYYKRAQKIDEWPGEDYEGTSVLAGARVMKELGFISEYRWCFSIEELKAAVISQGPVVIGIPWHSSMYGTDQSGIVRIYGENVGGHCILITGYVSNMMVDGVKQEVFRWRNSWGRSYGIEGSAFITYSDLESLVKSNAEMCVPIGRNIPSGPISLTAGGFCSKLFTALKKKFL